MEGPFHPLRVTVVGPDANVRANAIVAIVQSPMALPEIARRTNGAGECRLALPPGMYTFEAHAGDGLHARETVSVQGPSTLVLRLREE